jgi:hypothetical protein
MPSNSVPVVAPDNAKVRRTAESFPSGATSDVVGYELCNVTNVGL